MALNKEQQLLVEQNLSIIPKVIAAFNKKMPCLRQVAKCCDLESAAYLAICKAARTYNPDHPAAAAPSTYFYRAIHHALLREVQREINSNAHSIARIPLDEIYNRQRVTREEIQIAYKVLGSIPEQQRDWIERMVLYGSRNGGGFANFARESGIDHRRVRKIILEILERLALAAEDLPH